MQDNNNYFWRKPKNGEINSTNGGQKFGRAEHALY